MNSQKISVGICLYNKQQLEAVTAYTKENNIAYELGVLDVGETEEGTWDGRMIDLFVNTESEVQQIKNFASTQKLMALTEDEEDTLFAQKALEDTKKNPGILSQKESDKFTRKILSSSNQN